MKQPETETTEERKMNEETIIKADITQVEEGIRYKGNITFDECRFQYKIAFGIPVPQLNEAVKRNPNEKDIMDRMYLEVTDVKAEKISLEAEVKAVFMGVIGPLALELHYNHPARNGNYFNTRLLSLINDQGSPFSVPGVSVGFNMKKEHRWPKIPVLEKFLEGHKK